jgi:2-haloacid dehalogenase
MVDPRTQMSNTKAVKAVLFDVFGTVVDWRTSLIEDLAAYGQTRGIHTRWTAFVDEWRALYQPSMEEVRSGRRAWTILDVLHRESLDILLSQHGLGHVSEEDRAYMVSAWHRLKPWPDVVAGLTRLRTRYIIGTLSNGNVGLLTRMAKNNALPWDVILGAETARAYKPMPMAYLSAAALLNLMPGEVMLAAAHNSDLAAAQQQGLATAFIPRPLEYGPNQKLDLSPDGPWDVIASDFGELATQMGCA